MDFTNLPKKRGAAGVLIFNSSGKILLLEPRYKNNWEIPGGIIEKSESPKETCVREVKEEIGCDFEVGRLLCLEYQRENDDSYMFIFEGGIISDEQIENIIIQTSELNSFGFYTLSEIQYKVLPKMFQRILFAIEASKLGTIHYYETIY